MVRLLIFWSSSKLTPFHFLIGEPAGAQRVGRADLQEQKISASLDRLYLFQELGHTPGGWQLFQRSQSLAERHFVPPCGVKVLYWQGKKVNVIDTTQDQSGRFCSHQQMMRHQLVVQGLERGQERGDC